MTLRQPHCATADSIPAGAPARATNEAECVANARRICRASAVPAFVLALPAGWTAPVRAALDSATLDAATLDAATLDANEPLAALLGKAAVQDVPAADFLGPLWPAVTAAVMPLLAPADGVLPDGAPLGLSPPSDPGGEPLPCAAVPLTENGRTVGVLVLAEEAAGPRASSRMEKAMLAEIERTSAARSRFLASASHDLRQPFQAMRLFLDALLAQIGDERALQTAEMLGNAMTAGERLLNALLDISTLDAGTVTADVQAVDLRDLLGQLAEEFRPQSAEKGLFLRAHLRPGMAVTDPVLFGRIIRNLLSNAIRYTRQGGLLLAMRRRGDRWRIEVWDTGFGIPEEQLSAIFDEFHQLENPNRDPSRGLGLGLAIVRRLSELLGTEIEVRSRIGRGTVFAVSLESAALPAEPPPPTQPVPPPAPVKTASPLAGMTILAVDDEVMVLTGLTMILESWGCTVAAASDMREVFAVLDGLPEPPAVILTDLRLPGTVSGFDVIDRVRRLYGQDIPAVVLSGETAPSALLEGQRRGCSFLHKPLHPGHLRQVLEQFRRT